MYPRYLQRANIDSGKYRGDTKMQRAAISPTGFFIQRNTQEYVQCVSQSYFASFYSYGFGMKENPSNSYDWKEMKWKIVEPQCRQENLNCTAA